MTMGRRDSAIGSRQKLRCHRSLVAAGEGARTLARLRTASIVVTTGPGVLTSVVYTCYLNHTVSYGTCRKVGGWDRSSVGYHRNFRAVISAIYRYETAVSAVSALRICSWIYWFLRLR